MEVMLPVARGMDFDFNSARTTPYPTAPSTPRRVGEYYFSAPSSPRRISDFYREFDALLIENEGLLIGNEDSSSSAEVPFDWEVKPGVPKSYKESISMYEEHDFAFDLSGELQRPSLSAEELFDGGVIKPLKPPPRLQAVPSGEDEYSGEGSPGFSPRSHKSRLAQGKKLIQGAFSPKEKKDGNTFGASIEDNRRREPERERGRERSYPLSSSSRRAARSVSPIRVSESQWVDDMHTKQSTASLKPPLPASTNTSTLATFSKGFKWKLKDLFLFRSASDGRALAKDPLKKYSAFIRKQEDLMNASSRSIDASRTGSTSSRRRGNVSAHELHYTVNRAYSEDMKKKTFLPYKQGILGRLSFNPTVSYGLGFTRN